MSLRRVNSMANRYDAFDVRPRDRRNAVTTKQSSSLQARVVLANSIRRNSDTSPLTERALERWRSERCSARWQPHLRAPLPRGPWHTRSCARKPQNYCCRRHRRVQAHGGRLGLEEASGARAWLRAAGQRILSSSTSSCEKTSGPTPRAAGHLDLSLLRLVTHALRLLPNRESAAAKARAPRTRLRCESFYFPRC